MNEETAKTMTAAEIVQKLAAAAVTRPDFDKFGPGQTTVCTLCSAWAPAGEEVKHTARCPYRLAREWMCSHREDQAGALVPKLLSAAELPAKQADGSTLIKIKILDLSEVRDLISFYNEAIRHRDEILKSQSSELEQAQKDLNERCQAVSRLHETVAELSGRISSFAPVLTVIREYLSCQCTESPCPKLAPLSHMRLPYDEQIAEPVVSYSDEPGATSEHAKDDEAASVLPARDRLIHAWKCIGCGRVTTPNEPIKAADICCARCSSIANRALANPPVRFGRPRCLFINARCEKCPVILQLGFDKDTETSGDLRSALTQMGWRVHGPEPTADWILTCPSCAFREVSIAGVKP